MIISESWIGRAAVIRTFEGFVKFGVITKIQDNYILLRYFSGKEVLIIFDDIASIRPYEKRGRWIE